MPRSVHLYAEMSCPAEIIHQVHSVDVAENTPRLPAAAAERRPVDEARQSRIDIPTPPIAHIMLMLASTDVALNLTHRSG